jgi:hypothetical protein
MNPMAGAVPDEGELPSSDEATMRLLRELASRLQEKEAGEFLQGRQQGPEGMPVEGAPGEELTPEELAELEELAALEGG